MNNRIVYKDIANGAAEAATYTSSDATNFSDFNFSSYDQFDVEQISDGVIISDAPFSQSGGALFLGAGGKFATFEKNQWVLDGTYALRSGDVVYWSNSISDDNGEFSTNPTITATLTGRYTSAGLSIVFDSATGDYCSDINIKWYYNSTLLKDADFAPNGASYFCEQIVEAFNKIVITFKKTALPHRYVKVEQLIYGVIREFDDDELSGVTIINEFDLITATLPASTLEFTFYPDRSAQYMFQFKQMLEVYHGNNLIGVYYIDDAAQSASNIYSVRANDAIGVLGNESFPGAAYLSGISAKTLLETVIGSKWTINYENVTDTTLYGVLLQQSVREAVQQIAFAWGVCISTDGTDEIRVFYPSNTSTETLSEDIVYDGASITTDAITTLVRVYAHTYTLDPEGDIEIGNDRYLDTKTSHQISNPSATSNTKTNSHTVESATLVSPDNLNAVTQRVYDFYTRRNTVKGAFVWNGEKLGDAVTFPTNWTTNTASVTMMRLTLSGIAKADFEARGI